MLDHALFSHHTLVSILRSYNRSNKLSQSFIRDADSSSVVEADIFV